MTEDAITTEAQVAYELNKLRIQRERLLLKLDQAELVRARVAMKREPSLYKLAIAVVTVFYAIAICLVLSMEGRYLSESVRYMYCFAIGATLVTPTVVLAMLMRAVFKAKRPADDIKVSDTVPVKALGEATVKAMTQ